MTRQACSSFSSTSTSTWVPGHQESSPWDTGGRSWGAHQCSTGKEVRDSVGTLQPEQTSHTELSGEKETEDRERQSWCETKAAVCKARLHRTPNTSRDIGEGRGRGAQGRERNRGHRRCPVPASRPQLQLPQAQLAFPTEASLTPGASTRAARRPLRLSACAVCTCRQAGPDPHSGLLLAGPLGAARALPHTPPRPAV